MWGSCSANVGGIDVNCATGQSGVVDNEPDPEHPEEETRASEGRRVQPSSKFRPVTPNATATAANVQQTEVTASPDDRRAEYSEINQNIRHYSSLRFAIITVFLAATGGLASVAFNAFSLRTEKLDLVQMVARIVAALVAALFLQYEVLIGGVLAHNRKVGAALEVRMGLAQIRTRSPTRIAIAHWFARVLYLGFLVFWLWAIWEIVHHEPPPCDNCV